MPVARRGTALTGGNGGFVASVTPNAPAATADSDLWLVYIHAAVASGTLTISTPSGWTAASGNPLAGGVPTEFAFAFWKKWSTGDPTSQAFTFSQNSAYGYVSAAYSGVNVVTPVGDQQAAQDSTNNTTLDTPTINLQGNGSWSVLMPSLITSSVTFSAGPLSSGWSNFGENTTAKRTRIDDNGSPGSSGANVAPGQYTLSASSRGGIFHLELLAEDQREVDQPMAFTTQATWGNPFGGMTAPQVLKKIG